MACFNSFRLTVAALASVVAYLAFFNENEFALRLRRAPAPISTVSDFCANPGDVSMTFDGGPGPTTASVVQALNAANTKATFHVTTSYLNQVSVVTNMQVAYKSGHLIGLRFPTNLDPSTMSEDQLINTLLSDSLKVYNAIGVYPKYLRLPVGSTNSAAVGVAQALGFVVTGYNIDSSDYMKGTSAEKIIAAYNAQFSQSPAGQARYISVHQDLVTLYGDQTVLGKVVTNIKNNGYNVVTLDVCTGQEKYRSANVDYRDPSKTFTGKSIPSDASTTTTNSLVGSLSLITLVATLANIFF